MPSTLAQGAITEAVAEINATLPPGMRLVDAPETVLTGSGRTIDSLGLVMLIGAVESAVQRRTGRIVVIATDPDAFGTENPLATLGSLTAWIATRITTEPPS
ncbi:hypothetical protein [Magnetospirillum moscoviense]|uniref:Carrier domain-containing protein n=1 Tax=Magnetospirillum moscoviense TaxID=1437059 RepID=A0A178MYI2_9PROT|nr:hypothetical protein [Magnetospirillum moscoviense]OAN55087.1 hypothetical protein A6A05_00570 [Magnetospirillum moscoviense]